MAFLVASTFTNQAPLAVEFSSKGNDKEGGGSLGPDFNGCGTCSLVSSLKTPETTALQDPVLSS